MKKINILLTKYSDLTSNLIYHIAGHGYTHASVALGDSPQEYYSFNYKGFAIETLEKHKRRGVRRSRCYQVNVSDEAYRLMEEKIKIFKENKRHYKYSRIAVLCCVLHLPLKFRNRYFCSQFVAELLENETEIDIGRKPCFFLPNHFSLLLEKHPRCAGVIENAL